MKKLSMRKISKKASIAILVTYIVLQVALIWFLLLCVSYWQYLVQQGALTTIKFNLLIGAVILYISLALIYPIWWFKKHKKKQRR